MPVGVPDDSTRPADGNSLESWQMQMSASHEYATANAMNANQPGIRPQNPNVQNPAGKKPINFRSDNRYSPHLPSQASSSTHRRRRSSLEDAQYTAYMAACSEQNQFEQPSDQDAKSHARSDDDSPSLRTYNPNSDQQSAGSSMGTGSSHRSLLQKFSATNPDRSPRVRLGGSISSMDESMGSSVPQAIHIQNTNHAGRKLNTEYGIEETEAVEEVASPDFSGLYSSTGFDLLNILSRVALRPNPKIKLGPVDMSCSFVISDARKYDFPIVYVSPSFERFTGYKQAEIVGQNCRFLQSPLGQVEPGEKRKYTDNSAVYEMRNKQLCGMESQVSLINYRKGGQPFINMVTIIPITWDSGDVAFFVGFQVDLVDQPNAILAKMHDGSYMVNYRLTSSPIYIPPPLVASEKKMIEDVDDATLPNATEIAELLGGGTDDPDSTKRLWTRVLLEHTDDVILVLSLKGVFLYCSPSCREILEYDPEELIGRALSTVCHPSDIVPVMRELKDASSAQENINIIFRIRRKLSGYLWFELVGKLHVEQGKGRKYITMTGRERPVYQMPWHSISTSGGLSEPEFWAKLSVDGMILFASESIKEMLGISPEDIRGLNMLMLTRSESGHSEITDALVSARRGNITTATHTIQHQNGIRFNVRSTFYPGESSRIGKALFIIHQCRDLSSNHEPLHSDSRFNPIDSTYSEALESIESNASAPRLIRADSASSDESSSEYSHGTSGDRSQPLRPGTRPSLMEQEGTDLVFDQLETTRSTSWQYELHQLRLTNRRLKEELEEALTQKRKQNKRRKAQKVVEKHCSNCQRTETPGMKTDGRTSD